MIELINDSYNYEQVDDNPKSIKYDFVSLGPKDVPKRVSISKFEYESLDKYYNLGFCNILIDDDGKETLSDMSRDNNKNDKDKVLKTVFSCALDFLSNSQESILTFYGNTSAKHRLYKMGLNNNLNAIKSCFIIKGGIIKKLELIETLDEGKIPSSKIDINSIHFEYYAKQNSNKYNFITFELKNELK
jgi:hypothetical protein